MTTHSVNLSTTPGQAHATFAEAVYVLHAFEKKTQETAARDLQIGRERFRALVAMKCKNDGPKEQR